MGCGVDDDPVLDTAHRAHEAALVDSRRDNRRGPDSAVVPTTLGSGEGPQQPCIWAITQPLRLHYSVVTSRDRLRSTRLLQTTARWAQAPLAPCLSSVVKASLAGSRTMNESRQRAESRTARSYSYWSTVAIPSICAGDCAHLAEVWQRSAERLRRRMRLWVGQLANARACLLVRKLFRAHCGWAGMASPSNLIDR